MNGLKLIDRAHALNTTFVSLFLLFLQIEVYLTLFDHNTELFEHIIRVGFFQTDFGSGLNTQIWKLTQDNQCIQIAVYFDVDGVEDFPFN